MKYKHYCVHTLCLDERNVERACSRVVVVRRVGAGVCVCGVSDRVALRRTRDSLPGGVAVRSVLRIALERAGRSALRPMPQQIEGAIRILLFVFSKVPSGHGFAPSIAESKRGNLNTNWCSDSWEHRHYRARWILPHS